jgi:Spy/CpxP family protein refolding chaperone
MRTQYLAGLSLALTLGAASVAAAQTTTPATPDQSAAASSQAPATNQDGSQTSHRHWRHHSRLFRGVKLTQDERTKLSSIRDQYRTQLQPLVHQIRTARHSIRTAAARADTAAVNAARATLRDVRSNFTAARTKWMSDARAVLTPDQQAQFDKNVARMQKREAAHANRKSQS